MKIATLAARFQHYATINTDLAFDQASTNSSFLVCDIEEILNAIKTGISLPVMFLQVPEFSKEGNADNAIESVECAFMILNQGAAGNGILNLQVYDQCKDTADQVINYMVEDSPDYYEGATLKTAEGKVGPIGDQLYGWVVNFGFDQSYNAQADPAKRRDL